MAGELNSGSGGNGAVAANWAKAVTNSDGTPYEPGPVVVDGKDSWVLGQTETDKSGPVKSVSRVDGKPKKDFIFGQDSNDIVDTPDGVGHRPYFTRDVTGEIKEFPTPETEKLSETSPLDGGHAKIEMPEKEEKVLPPSKVLLTDDGRPVFKPLVEEEPVISAKPVETIVAKPEPAAKEETLAAEADYDPHDSSYFKKGQANLKALEERRKATELAQAEAERKPSFVESVVGFFKGKKPEGNKPTTTPSAKSEASKESQSIINDPTDKKGERKPFSEAKDAVEPIPTAEELRRANAEKKADTNADGVINATKPVEITAKDGGNAKPVPSSDPNKGNTVKPTPLPENNPKDGGTAKPTPSPENNPKDGSGVKPVPTPKPVSVEKPAASSEAKPAEKPEATSSVPNPKDGGTAKPMPSEKNNPNTGGTAKPMPSPENNPNTGGTAKPVPSPENNPNTGGTAKPSAAAQERMEKQVQENIREKIKERGGKVLGAAEDVYLVATEGLTGKEAEKEAASIAYQAMVAYDERVKAERDAKDAAKAQKLIEQGKKPGGFLTRVIKGIPTGFYDRTIGTVKRTIAVKNYYKTALAAIKKTGRGSAGKTAVELTNQLEAQDKADLTGKSRLGRFAEQVRSDARDTFAGVKSRRERREEVVDAASKDVNGNLDERVFNPLSDDYALEKYGGVIDPDKAMLDRAVQARRAGALNMDKGVEFKGEMDSPLQQAIKTFAKEVASYDKSVDTDTEISREDFNKEMAKRDAARKAVTEAINKSLGGGVNNAAEVVRMIERNLSGTLTEELNGAKGEEAHKEAIAAIDEYIDKHFHFDKFKVTDTGLAVDEGRAKAKWTDVLTLKTNLFTGIAVGLGSSMAVGLAKSAVIQHITNSQIVMAGMKVVIATGVGFQRGYSRAKKEQVKENIDAALGLEKQGKNEGMRRKLGRDFTELMLNVDGAIEDLKSDIGNMGEEAKQAKIKDIASILARLDLQEKHAGKVNLFVYNGRDKIERGKADMFKAMNDAIEALKAGGVENVEELIATSRAEQFSDLSKVYGKIARNQFAWRMGRGAMTGALAGLTAATATIVMDKFRGNKLEEEIRDLAQGRKKFSGLNVVDVESAAVGGAVVEETVNQQPVVKEEIKDTRTPEQMEIDRQRANSQVLIEESNNGGQSVGFDVNKNGKLDEGEYLIGGGRERGVNLANDADFETANAKLSQYGVELTRDPTFGQKNVPVSVSEYVNSQSNAVKGININNVNWNKSQQLVSIERDIVVHPNDGMELYEVPVDGKIPSGAKLYIDLDGDGPGAPLEYEIVNGKAIVPASVLDTSRVGTGGTAKLLGTVRVAKIEDNQFISYTTNTGKVLSGDSVINSKVDHPGYAISVIKHGENGQPDEIINQAAVDGNGHTVSNLSETFNGRATNVSDRVPYMMKETTTGGAGAITLADGAEIKEYTYSGGYQEKFDASLNYMFKEKATYVGTPMTLDVNGDGLIDSTESAAYINQMFVRTATNPYVLMQNASAYGVLEPDVMTDLGFTQEVLANRFGIVDGQIDTMEELNAFLEKLKLSENADWYDKLVNRTLGTMRTDLAGAELEMVTLGDRTATYLNNENSLDFIHASRNRTAVTYYKMVDGQKVYIGNKGFMYGKDNKEPAYDILACEQKGKRPPRITTTTPTIIRTTPVITTTPVIRTTPVITTTMIKTTPVITTTMPTTTPRITTTMPTTTPRITTTMPTTTPRITTTLPTTTPIITTTLPTTTPIITTTLPTTLPPKVTPTPMDPGNNPGDGKLPTPTPTVPGQPTTAPGPITEEPGVPYVPTTTVPVTDEDIDEYLRLIRSRQQQ